MERLLLFTGHIRNYDVIITEAGLKVLEEGEESDTSVRIEWKVSLGSFLKQAQDLRLGWAEFPDFEVIYLYDKADRNYGYAVNLDDPGLSEWGYAPFADEETEGQDESEDGPTTT